MNEFKYDKIFTVGSLNLYGRKGDFDQRSNLLINELSAQELQIIFLQEVLFIDRKHPVIDALEIKGYKTIFFPTLKPNNRVNYGNAILHIGECLDTNNIKLPTPNNIEPRNAIISLIAVYGNEIILSCTHLSHGQTRNIRNNQLREIHNVLLSTQQERKAPIIFGGDLNSSKDDIDDSLKQSLKGFMNCHGTAPSIKQYRKYVKNNQLAQKRGLSQKVDYLFLRNHQKHPALTLSDSSYFAYMPNSNGVYPSDHIGIKASFQFCTGS